MDINASAMNEIEISSIFHEVFLIFSYFAGLISSIIVGRKNNVHPSVTTLMLLICTFSYLFFSDFFMTHSENWYQVIQSGFPHIEKSFGLIGVVLGLFVSGMLLRIPLSIVYKFSFPILIVYGVSNLGCIGGHCRDVHTGLFQFRDYLNGIASFEIGHFWWSGQLIDRINIPILFKIMAGFITITTIYQFQDKFKNPKNVFLMVFSSIFFITFINQFLIDPVISYPVFDRLLGMNIFQWAIFIVTSFTLMSVISNEFSRKHRCPKLMIKLPSNYMIFSIYAVIFIITFRDSSFISKTNPAIFIIGFSITTLFLIIYFHKKIQLSAIRYTTIVVLLAVGLLFLQMSIFNPEYGNPEDLSGKDEKKVENQNIESFKRINNYTIPDSRGLQFVKSHLLGHQSLTLSPINSFTDIVVEKYADYTTKKSNNQESVQ